ncbi:MAG: deoxyribose-phosphate aldolase [Myxococcales bacterium]|nr:deoxyribose-phosphate aldolase [Myxococcales bacterium]
MKHGDLAQYIEHTVLKPEATRSDVERCCNEATKHQFRGVCVAPGYVPDARRALAGSSPLIVSVVGFPLGTEASTTKAYEAREAVRAGAHEIDMVIHLGALKARELHYVHKDIHAVVSAVPQTPVKVIIEAATLVDEEKVIACALAVGAGAAFVKTSTGFHAAGGAKAEDVRLMRSVVGTACGVKASGGIRTFEDAQTMIEAGASRLGTSASVRLVCQS